MSQAIFSDTDAPSVDDDTLAELRDIARNSPRGRARFCLHQNHEDPLQEMVIALHRSGYIPPHRQIGRAKSYLCLEGKLFVCFFDDAGSLVERLQLSAQGDNGPSIVRFPANRWHTVTALTEIAIYVEVVPGPYVPEETKFADWAPSETDADAAKFLESLQAG